MRKLLGFILILAVLTPLAAQTADTPPASLLSNATFSLFQNEFDLLFQNNTEFGNFKQHLLFAGLGNPGQEAAEDFGLSGNLEFGYYFPELLSVPVSLYGSANVSPFTLLNKTGKELVTTYGAKAVTSGTTTTNMPWISSSVETTYKTFLFASTLNTGIQALTKLNDTVLGLRFYYNLDSSAKNVAAANDYFKDMVSTFNVDTAGAGVAPTAVQDYTITENTKNINPAAIPAAGAGGLYLVSSNLKLGVPFAFKTGTVKHTAFAGLALDLSDNPGAYSVIESVHSETAGGASVNDQTVDIKSSSGKIALNTTYGMEFPAGDADNFLKFTGALDLGLKIKSYSYDNLTRPYDHSVVDAKTGLAGGTQSSTIDKYAPGFDMTLGLGASRQFALKPIEELQFRFSPSAYASYSLTTSAAPRTERVAFVKTLDAAGNQQGNLTTTTTLTSGVSAYTSGFAASASLPMGLVFTPKGWKFGFIGGANPRVQANPTTTVSSAEIAVATDVVTDTAGAVVSSAITTTTNSPVSTFAMTYSITEAHYLGITLGLDNGVRFDAFINGNLLSFESFTIQGIIPLDMKK